MAYDITEINRLLDECENNPYRNPGEYVQKAIDFVAEQTGHTPETVRRIIELHFGVYLAEIDSAVDISDY
jgi:hypothetical protein